MYSEHVTLIFYKNAPNAEDKNDLVTPQYSAQKVDNNVYCSLHESKLSNLFFEASWINLRKIKRVTQRLELRACRIHKIRELRSTGQNERVGYCLRFRHRVSKAIYILDDAFITNKAWFHYKWICKIWSGDHPHIFKETVLGWKS